MSCVSSSRAEVAQLIEELRAKGIQNVLALRGDIPDGMTVPEAGYYKYAYQLVEEIKSRGDFCVGAACYPEGHVECASSAADLSHLKAKVDCGCDFLITQMFFDNHVLYSFLDRFGDNPAALKQAGIAYATDQIIDLLANGVKGIHLYTMNKPDVAQKIVANLSEILA